MDQKTIVLTVLSMALVTAVIRLAPVYLLAGRKLPENFATWLRFIPITILSAMLAPEVFLRNGQLDFSTQNLYFWISLPTFAFSLVTRSLFGTVFVGMIGIAAVRYFTS